MHATNSLDFLIVHKGQVTLQLDSGEKQLVKEGEVIGTSASVFLLQGRISADGLSPARHESRMGE